MKCWPIPNSFLESLPTEGDRGSYWEDRHIGFNCGVDIFCPQDSNVFVIESGTVLNISQCTERSEFSCFESTMQCVIKCNSVMYKYSFLEEILISGQEDDEDEDDRLHEFDSLDSYSLQDDDDKSFDWRISDFKLHCDLMFRSHLIRLQQTDLRLLIEVFQI